MSYFSRLRGGQVDLVLLAVALVWGSSYLAAKDLTLVAAVLVVLSARFLVTTGAMVLVWLGLRPGLPSWSEAGTGVVLGCSQAAILALETFGVARTSATNAGLIISLTVIVTPVLESLWRRRWLPAPFFLAAVAAVVGVALLVSGSRFHAPNTGDLLVLGAAVVRSAHVTITGWLTAGRAVSSVTITTLQSATCAVIFSACAGSGLLAGLDGLSASGWAGVGYLALACGAFAFLAQLWGIRQTSASRASLLTGTEPVWAVAVGVLVGGETLHPVGAIGAVVIVAATFAGQRIEARHRAESAAPVSTVSERAPAPAS